MGGAVPPHILLSDQRPDLLIADPRRRKLVIIELTIPAEQNAVKAAMWKTVKYAELVEDARVNGWDAHLKTVEVCTRGMIAASSVSQALNFACVQGLLSYSRADIQPLL